MDIVQDITTLLKARNPLMFLTSKEEQRAEYIIIEGAANAKYPVRFCDTADGITDSTGETIVNLTGGLTEALRYIQATNDRCVYVFRDLHRWLGPIEIRMLKSLARKLLRTPLPESRAIIVLCPSIDLPEELSTYTVLDLPLPTREDMGTLLDDIMSSVPEGTNKILNGEKEAAIDAAVGLTAEEASNCYFKSIVSKKGVDPAMVVQEKKRVIAKEKVITWIDPDPRGLDGVAGCEVLRTWLEARKQAFTAKARDFGLPAPKGVFLAGVSGCGKSLTAKCIASAWNVPLLRLDMGALKSKYVGESEQNFRNALKVSEAVSPCVLWLDEVEKALAGATGAQGDGGVSSDALGALLTWMQEKESSVFVVATANQIDNLPPEFLRKGRFDELFFIDLPTQVERKAIAKVTLVQFKRTSEEIDLDKLATATDGFSGAEIAALVPEALFAAFYNNERAITTEDLVNAANATIPLSKTAGEKIEALRKWARGCTKPASLPADNTNTRQRVVEV